MKTKLLGVVAALALFGVVSPGYSDSFLYSGGSYTFLAGSVTGINNSGQMSGYYTTGSHDSYFYSGGSYTNFSPPGSSAA